MTARGAASNDPHTPNARPSFYFLVCILPNLFATLPLGGIPMPHMGKAEGYPMKSVGKMGKDMKKPKKKKKMAMMKFSSKAV